MVWLLRDFDFLAVFLRAGIFSFEALIVGGIAYILLIARPARVDNATISVCRTVIGMASLGMIACQILSTAVSSAILMGGSQLHFSQIVTTGFFISSGAAVFCSLAILLLLRIERDWAQYANAALALLILCANVSTSHALTRLEHRGLLLTLTAAHHLGTAIWIGAMPFLLLTLRRAETSIAVRMVGRYSTVALVGAGTLAAAGVGMAWLYVGTWGGMYGTSYGLMLGAKICLFMLMLAVGAGNFLIVQKIHREPETLLARLRRLGEVEIGLGFTILIVAAALTSQSPAVDVTLDRPNAPEIAQRLHLRWPRLKSPALGALAPPTSMAVAVREAQFSGGGGSDENDKEWSEYNHHWAGLVVLTAGLLAFASRVRGGRWARHWPLAFIGLAVFILLRADPENWPLGPRGFWESFATPDVLQHRLFAVLITVFAFFEWCVQTDKVRAKWPTLIFPATCALGGAVLLSHSHSGMNSKDELLIEMNHTAIAVFGITAGWTRWADLRFPISRVSRPLRLAWPFCIAIVGLLLLQYRET